MTSHDIYLNHAGTSWPKPDAVTKAIAEATEVAPTEWPDRFEQAHHSIADFFGVNRADQILLTPGCTSALAVGIGDLIVPSGKRVLTSLWEHHALHRPLSKLGATGIRLEQIPTAGSVASGESYAPIDLDWLGDALSIGDVALVAITAACNVTGEVLPYEEVIRLAHRHGSMVCIDAAQVVGWLDLDLPGLDADMVAFGGHKGLQAPWGIGGLYLSDRARMECVSATCDIPSVSQDPSAGQDEVTDAPRPGYCDVGSVDLLALAGLQASVGFLRAQSLPSRLDQARRQIQRIGQSLAGIDGVRTYGPASADKKMPSLAFSLEGISSGDLASRFRRHRLVVGSGIQCAPLAHQTLGTGDSGLVRLSVGFGQQESEIDEAIARLRSVLGETLGEGRPIGFAQ